MVTKCRNCGADNPDEATVCGKCGATLPTVKGPTTLLPSEAFDLAAWAFVFSCLFGVAAMAAGAWIIEDSLGGGVFLVAVGVVVTTATIVYALTSEKWKGV
jgi:hypothetical protein